MKVAHTWRRRQTIDGHSHSRPPHRNRMCCRQSTHCGYQCHMRWLVATNTTRLLFVQKTYFRYRQLRQINASFFLSLRWRWVLSSAHTYVDSLSSAHNARPTILITFKQHSIQLEERRRRWRRYLSCQCRGSSPVFVCLFLRNYGRSTSFKFKFLVRLHCTPQSFVTATVVVFVGNRTRTNSLKSNKNLNIWQMHTK